MNQRNQSSIWQKGSSSFQWQEPVAFLIEAWPVLFNLDVLQNYPNPMAAANVHSQEFPQRNGYYTHIIRK